MAAILAGGDRVFRKVILGVAGNRLISGLATRHGLSVGARRFVAGETLEEGIGAARRLNAGGLRVSLDHLGEGVHDPESARQATEVYLRVLERIDTERLQANVSVKLTQLGLAIDPQLAESNVRRIAEAARDLGGNFVRIDMEDSPWVDHTLRIYRNLEPLHRHLGVVIQSYLYRSEQDVRALLPLRPNVRLCKGAYAEPPSVAFPKKRDVDANYRKLARILLSGGAYLAAATHDEKIIDYVKGLARELEAGPDRFEFQMLYGIRPALQRQLVAEGYRVRIYVPFGTAWYPYFVRRLAERPANVAFVLRGLRR